VHDQGRHEHDIAYRVHRPKLTDSNYTQHQGVDSERRWQCREPAFPLALWL
jgi:hypothetical protein